VLFRSYEKAYVNRGYIYAEKRNFKKAIKDYNRAIELNPGSIYGYFDLGVAYYSLGERDRAIECYKKAAQLGDNDAQEWLRTYGYNW
jgi:tetratricopeptide (TPR) repeat protein